MDSTFVLYDFNKDQATNTWRVVDDVVMGGKSNGHFEMNDEGHGRFYGSVSLENNGGFSSIMKRIDPVTVEDYEVVMIRLKGDGSTYQFRIKDDPNQRHSYIRSFETSGDWETIELPLEEFAPSFRGRRLAMPNFDQKEIAELRFLIGNKKPQEFNLLIDEIRLAK